MQRLGKKWMRVMGGVAVVSFVPSSQVLAVNWFVDQSVVSTIHDGEDWDTAFLTIQEAIDAANQEGDVIFIAEGEYHVDDGVTTLPSEPSTLTFELKPGIRWEGGYPTGGGTADPVSHPVVLHGSIALSGGGTDFAYHVVTADDPSSSPDLSSLSGLTITKGRANGGGANSDGGGVYAPGRTPAITQCRIVGCQATSSTSNEGRGGGLFLSTGDLITIRQTEFIDNRGTDSGGMGRYPDDSDPTPTANVAIIMSRFRGNLCTGGRAGGCLLGVASGLVNIVDTDFVDNESNAPSGQAGGGGLTVQQPYLCSTGSCVTPSGGSGCASACYECSELCTYCGTSCTSMLCADCPTHVTLTNCLIAGNIGRGAGGGGMRTSRKTAFNNCTIVDNYTDQCTGGGGAALGHEAVLRFNNCILRGNTVGTTPPGGSSCPGSLAVIKKQVEGTCGVDYELHSSNVEGWPESGVSCTGHSADNIDEDPDFRSAADFNYRLLTGSPSLDAGNNDDVPLDDQDADGDAEQDEFTPDSDRHERIRASALSADVIVDHGAYEAGCDGDRDDDNDVDGVDLATLLGQWTGTARYISGTPCYPIHSGDLVDGTGSGSDDGVCKVNGLDLAALLAQWDGCPDHASPGGGESAAQGGEGAGEETGG